MMEVWIVLGLGTLLVLLYVLKHGMEHPVGPPMTPTGGMALNFLAQLQSPADTRLPADDPAPWRERFRRDLIGVWHTFELVPLGYIWEFRADGTGTVSHCSGMNVAELSFEWRPVAEWTIDIKILYPPSPLDLDGIAQNEWERVHYDFAVVDVDFYQTVVLYEVDFPGGELGFCWREGALLRANNE